MRKLIRLRALGPLVAFVALLMVSNVGTAGTKGAVPPPLQSAQAAVEDLVVCYARGTDTLGRAVNAVVSGPDPEDPVNIGDPDFDAALALYRQCFSKDFSFTLEFDIGVPIPPQTVPDPAGGPGQDGALQWANFVNNAFRGPGYRNTQHHMGSISSEIDGNTAHVVSYLIATHAFISGGVSVVGGTYTDDVVFEDGRWVILHRNLLITSSALTP